ncbi:MAG: hypothetical protein PVJ47_06665 [Thiohalocapsa sp.]|jgi:hypothetical protein|uniref:hypothetical protein n=1 Tax=Thiohalocapsa sp. TaxID=2497641 RepID=UPI0025F2B3BD|nr:hypothetical protein [Thiohalocapsa sp.]
MTERLHLILYHKQRSSARLRFLRHAHGGVCTPGPLPADAVVQRHPCDAETSADGGRLQLHPGMLLRATEANLGLPRGCLEPDAGFRGHVCSADGCAAVRLASFTNLDPPMAAAASVGATFLDLTAARGLPAAELALLRLAYEHVLG